MTNSAALAYYTIFSLAPICIVIVTVLGSILSKQAIENRVMGALHGFVGNADISDFIQAFTNYYRLPVAGLLAAIVSFIVIVVASLTLFTQIQHTLSAMWLKRGKKAYTIKRYLEIKVVAVIMVIFVGLLIIASFVINIVMPIAIMTFVYVIGLLILMYKYMPNAPVSWKAAVSGGIGAGALFFVGRFLLGLYITTSVASSIYGAAGAVLLILVWLYYIAQVFIYGGALTHTIDEKLRSAETV